MTAEVEADHNSPFVTYQLPGPGPSRQSITNSTEERMDTDIETQTEQIPIIISSGEIPAGADVIEVPLVSAFDANGPCALIGDLEPENCDHQGSAWSCCLDLRCKHCGSRLFMPPRFLAYRPKYELEIMYSAWVRAGWPHWIAGPDAHWHAPSEYWTIVPHPLFNDVGGLAVSNKQLDSFSAHRWELE